MALSRRQLLAAVPAILAVAAACSDKRTTINVRDHGAAGNGTADDSAAIIAAAAAMKSQTTLYFPKGTYRFARQSPPGAAAIVLNGLSDIDVIFDPDAELVMDNLNPADQTGTGHAILIKGPSARITLNRIKIRWAKQPSRLSFGDGIRILGYPVVSSALAPAKNWSGATSAISNVTISDCQITSSPQAGITVIGSSDINVSRVRVQDSRADSLHFNACRQATIDQFTSVNAGADGLALVTYYADVFAFDTSTQEFSFPDVNDWSDADFTITNVAIQTGQGGGVRLAGAKRVKVSDLTVKGVTNGPGVIIDSAAPDSDVSWSYGAAREIHLNKLDLEDCAIGIQLLARPGAADDDRFTDFDVEATDITIRNCSNWAARVESLTPQWVTGLRLDNINCEATSTTGGNGGIGLGNAHLINLGHISIRHTHAAVAFATTNSSAFKVDRLQIAITEINSAPGVPACAQFDASDGVIKEMDIDWLSAPGWWVPFRIVDHGNCVNPLMVPAVDVRTLTMNRAIPTRVFGC